MADWIDRRLGDFCKSIQNQIDELPFLDEGKKKIYFEMLKECADKVDKTSEDSVVYLRRELRPLADDFRMRSGKFLRIG